MLANFFEKTKPINSIVVGLVFFIFYFSNVFLSENIEYTGFNLLMGLLFLLTNFLFILFSGVVVIGNKITNNNLFTPLIMVLLYALFPKTLVNNNTIYILVLFVLLYRRFSSLSEIQNSVGKLFDSGLLIGVLFLLFNWTILYFILVYAALILFQNLTIRKMLIPIVGFVVPVLFYYVYSMATENLTLFYNCFDFEVTKLDFEFYNKHQLEVIIISVMLLFSVVLKLPRMLSVSTIEKQQYTITIFSLLIGFVLFHFSQLENETGVLFVFIPIAIIIGQLIEMISKKGLKDFILVGFIVLSLVKLYAS